MGHYKQLMRLMKFIQKTTNYGLKFAPILNTNEPWQMSSYVDSDYAGDSVTRKSVSRWDIFINECLIGWG